jgi:hypothetical protein
MTTLAILSGKIQFETYDGKKKIYWRNNLPYGTVVSTGQEVRFNVLHYQGGSKWQMKPAYRGAKNSSPLRELLDSALCIYLPKSLKDQEIHPNSCVRRILNPSEYTDNRLDQFRWNMGTYRVGMRELRRLNIRITDIDCRLRTGTGDTLLHSHEEGSCERVRYRTLFFVGVPERVGPDTVFEVTN